MCFVVKNILARKQVIILSSKATFRIIVEENSVFQKVRRERIKTRIPLKKPIF
jgi:hypothetical protein